MVDVFSEDDVAFVGISHAHNTNEAAVNYWLNRTGWKIPTGIDNPEVNFYGEARETQDTFLVLDQEHNVAYKLVNGRTGKGFFPTLIQGIRRVVEATPVEEESWGAVKRGQLD